MHVRHLLIFGLLVPPSLASAGELTFSVQAFVDPVDFMITPTAKLDLRVRELIPAPGVNASTHFLVEGLSPLEEGTLVYASTYSGINAATGAIQDIGVLYLNMPESASLPEGTVSSPIVGVVQRAGAWSGYNPRTPITSLGGAVGPGAFEPVSGTMTLQLQRGAELFSGMVRYSVPDANTLTLEPFTLVKDGPVSYPLSGATLIRDGLRFAGTVTNLSPGAAYDSLLFAVELSGMADSDGDGIPDISDSEFTPGLLTPDQWNNTAYGWIYGFTPKLGYSTFLGFVQLELPWIYHFRFGWLHHSASTPLGAGATLHWFYSPDPALGWIAVSNLGGGYFQSHKTGWAWNNFLRPNP